MTQIVPAVGNPSSACWKPIPKPIAMCLFAFAVFIHFCSFTILFTRSVGALSVPSQRLQFVVIYLHPLPALAQGCLAIAHFYRLIVVIKCWCRFNRPTPNQSKNAKCSCSCFIKRFPFLFDIFHANGIFGRKGKLYEFRLAIVESMEIPAATYQAYSLSHYVSNKAINISYATLIFLNCIVSTITLNSTNIRLRRMGTLFFDTLFDFIFSVCFTSILLYTLVYEAFDRSRNGKRSPAWTSEVLWVGQQICESSLLDLITTLLPYLQSIISVRSLVGFICDQSNTYDRGNSMSESSKRIKTAKIESDQKLITGYSICIKLRLNVIFSSMATIWGTIVLCLALHAIHRGKCPKDCSIETHPWASSSCHCLVYDLNCRKMHLSTEQFFQHLDKLPLTTFWIQVSMCSLPYGVDMGHFVKYKNLHGLSLLYSNMKYWHNHSPWPESLMYIAVIGSELEKVPPFLVHHIPKRIRTLELSSSKINSIPDDAFFHWSELLLISFENCSLTSFPDSLLSMKKLLTLRLSHNRISKIPNDFSSSNLRTLDLTYNDITVFPKGYVPNRMRIFIDGNPLEHFPKEWTTSTIKSGRVSFRNSPICKRIKAQRKSDNSSAALEEFVLKNYDSYCQDSCSFGCNDNLVSNDICDFQCNVELCNWDGNDCKKIFGG